MLKELYYILFNCYWLRTKLSLAKGQMSTGVIRLSLCHATCLVYISAFGQTVLKNKTNTSCQNLARLITKSDKRNVFLNATELLHVLLFLKLTLIFVFELSNWDTWNQKLGHRVRWNKHLVKKYIATFSSTRSKI